jgi:hypothetical protein
MKYLAIVLSVLFGSCSIALAQGSSNGPGTVKGDAARSSVNPNAVIPGDHGQTSSNPSGSGTSPSGGKDDNPDHGFTAIPTDKAPHPAKNGK